MLWQLSPQGRCYYYLSNQIGRGCGQHHIKINWLQSIWLLRAQRTTHTTRTHAWYDHTNVVQCTPKKKHNRYPSEKYDMMPNHIGQKQRYLMTKFLGSLLTSSAPENNRNIHTRTAKLSIFFSAKKCWLLRHDCRDYWRSWKGRTEFKRVVDRSD